MFKDINELTGYKVTTSIVVELPFETSHEIAIWDALAQSLMIFSVGGELEGYETFELVYRSNTPDGENPQRLTDVQCVYFCQDTMRIVMLSPISPLGKYPLLIPVLARTQLLFYR